eukprot:CAMPEP_0115037538 /NCGR_PEP_ID=MMETSP0216-20121206/42860_1 /TAXON_ID=223996 /ORGANISM="Protocruzia adherens, Strain Boccale" /LENGTH=553 /DNA_ID=CAMNT_0002417741 /DNA_START=69 /DNA_END=1726 /DNA_ORIENTATION=-
MEPAPSVELDVFSPREDCALSVCPQHSSEKTIFYCHDDQAVGCVECMKDHQDHIPKLELISDVSRLKLLTKTTEGETTLFCPKHHRREDMWCKKEKRTKCPSCMLVCVDKEHTLEEFSPLHDSCMDKVNEWEENLGNDSDQVARLLASLEEFQERELKKIKDHFQELHKLIQIQEERQKKELMAQISRLRSRAVSPSPIRLQELRSSVTSLKSFTKIDLVKFFQSARATALSKELSSVSARLSEGPKVSDMAQSVSFLDQEALDKNLKTPNLDATLIKPAHKFIKLSPQGLFCLDVVTSSRLFLAPRPFSPVSFHELKFPHFSDAGARKCQRVSDGTLFIAGGFVSRGHLNSFYHYEPISGHLTELPQMPHSAAGFALMMAPQDLIIIAGGRSGQKYLKTVTTYDRKSASWASWPDLPEERGRADGDVVVMDDGGGGYLVYIFGGFNEDKGYFGDILVMNRGVVGVEFQSERWERVRFAGNFAVNGHLSTAVVGDGRVLILESSGKSWVYDWEKQEVNKLARGIFPKFHISCALEYCEEENLVWSLTDQGVLA